MIKNDLRLHAQIIYFENSFGEFTLGVYFETEIWDGAMMRSSNSILAFFCTNYRSREILMQNNDNILLVFAVHQRKHQNKQGLDLGCFRCIVSKK